MEYRIITGRNIDNSTVIVNDYIEKGRIPQGGVLINGMTYAQAMIKHND